MKNCLIKKIFLFLFFLIFLNFKVKATEQNNHLNDVLQQQYEDLEIDKLLENLPEETKKDLEKIDFNLKNPQDSTNFNFFKIFDLIFSKIETILKSPLTIFVNCLAIIIICGLINSFKTGDNFTANFDNAIGVLVALCTCGVIISPIVNVILNISNIIKNFSFFMLCYIPVFAGIIAISKGVLTSISYNSTLFFLAQLISSLTANILLPITSAFLALSISASVNSSFNVKGITSGIKKAVIFALSLLVTIFVGFFTIQSTISANADTMGLKTAKFLTSSFIPIIGSSLGDALSSIVSGLNIIKSAVGGFAIVVSIITLLPPILTVGFFIIFTSFAKEISQSLNIVVMPQALGAIKDCLSILMSFLVCYGILIVSTTSLIITLGVK